MKRPSRLNISYSWFILAASFAILFFNSGARFSFGVMFKPMITEFEWQRGPISLVFFLNMTLFALSLAVMGRFYDRYGPRWVIIISTLFLSGGYTLTATINALWQFFISYGLLAAIGFGGTSVPLIAAVVSKWFARWRGLAISLALCGSSVGQFVLIPLFTSITYGQGWRPAYLYAGLIMFVVNTILAFLVIRGDPDDLGKSPLGHGAEPKIGGREDPIPSHQPDLNLGAAMRTRSFWCFLIVMFICGTGDFLVSTHLVPMVTDYGVSSTRAGQMQAWYGLMSLAGILLAGPASDLIGNKIPIALTFLLRFLLFVLILKYQSVTSFYIFALAFGFTHLITAPLTPTLMGRLYGFTHVGLISGFITTIHHAAGGFWTYAGGVIFDRTGSYRLAFAISLAMAVIAVLGSVLIREKRHEAPR